MHQGARAAPSRGPRLPLLQGQAHDGAVVVEGYEEKGVLQSSVRCGRGQLTRLARRALRGGVGVRVEHCEGAEGLLSSLLSRSYHHSDPHRGPEPRPGGPGPS